MGDRWNLKGSDREVFERFQEMKPDDMTNGEFLGTLLDSFAGDVPEIEADTVKIDPEQVEQIASLAGEHAADDVVSELDQW